MNKLALSLMALALIGCGGGEPDNRAVEALEATAAARPRPQAMVAAAVEAADPALNAERLMDYAEAQYKEYFPGPEPTRKLGGWAYRYYAQSGVFLAVIDWRVYVVGGPFGQEVQDKGPVSDYIAISPLSNQPPSAGLTLSVLQTSPSTTLLLSADVADPDGTVAKVEYFDGETKLGQTTAAPHAYTFSSVAAGLHRLSVKATDDGGLTTTSTVSAFQVSAGTSPPVGTALTVASLSKCSTAFGSSAADSYKCLVGQTPLGKLDDEAQSACSLSIASSGNLTVTAGDRDYVVDVAQLGAAERHFSKTPTALSFDYGSATATAPAVRVKGWTQDAVPGKFFQQGGSLVVEVRRTTPQLLLTCTIPLALS